MRYFRDRCGRLVVDSGLGAVAVSSYPTASRIYDPSGLSVSRQTVQRATQPATRPLYASSQDTQCTRGGGTVSGVVRGGVWNKRCYGGSKDGLAWTETYRG